MIKNLEVESKRNKEIFDKANAQSQGLLKKMQEKFGKQIQGLANQNKKAHADLKMFNADMKNIKRRGTKQDQLKNELLLLVKK